MKTLQNHVYIYAKPCFSTPENDNNDNENVFSSKSWKFMFFLRQTCKHRFTIIIYMHVAPPIFMQKQQITISSCSLSMHASFCFSILHIWIFRPNTSWRLWTLRDAPGRSWRLLEAPRGSWTLLEAGIERPRNEETAVFQRLVL